MLSPKQQYITYEFILDVSNFTFPFSDKAWAKRIHETIHERTKNLISNDTVLGREKYSNNDELWRDVKDSALTSIAREDRLANRGPVVDYYQEISGYCVNCSTFGIDSPIIYTVTIWENGDYVVNVRCRMNCKHPLVPPNWKPPEKKPTPPSDAFLSLKNDVDELWYNHFLCLVDTVIIEIKEEEKRWDKYYTQQRKQERAEKRREKAYQKKVDAERRSERRRQAQECVLFLTLTILGAILYSLLLLQLFSFHAIVIAVLFVINLAIYCRVFSQTKVNTRSSKTRR